MSKKRLTILILIIFLVIGFASISGYLYINGTTIFEGSNREYDIYFSGATITAGGTISGIGSKTLTFSTNILNTIGDTSVIKYEVYNNSTEYDANIKLDCKLLDNNNYVSIKSLFDNIDTSIYDDTLVAQETKNGYIEITLINENNTDNLLELEYVCNIITTGKVR